MTACDRCHSTERGIDRSACLSCHQPIRTAIEKGRGWHGRDERGNAPCEQCHTEHKGRDDALIQWPDGSKKDFPHKATGFVLSGAHARQKCDACHNPGLVAEPVVKTYWGSHPQADIYLGLSKGCEACHSDEHRGQLKGGCERCHNEEKWSPAPGFDHAQTYKLEGAHARVACTLCHPKKPAAAVTGKLPTKSQDAAAYKPTPHAACTDCHKDPHSGRFGKRCLECHQMSSWRDILAGADRSFHDKTAFPLTGRHATVPCAHCHRVGADGKPKHKGIPHKHCTDCHPGAHPDMDSSRPEPQACEDCHTTAGFTPVRYRLAQHEKSRYPLAGSHRAVACPACHLEAMGTPRAVQKAKAAPGRLANEVVSPWRLKVEPEKFARCEGCHASPHRNQFEKRACLDCHVENTWKIGKFDHSKTSYALTGKHEKVACAACHAQERDAQGSFARYAPLPKADCLPCHADVHFGQFRLLEPVAPCATCHKTEGFKTLAFDHQRQEFSDFPLEGRHGRVACSGCHPKIKLAEERETVRYRPTPKTCAVCHEDPHRGAYREAASLAMDGSAAPSPPEKAGGAWSAPESWQGQKSDTPCETCHRAGGWDDLRFRHERTGFPLLGLHRRTACSSCHKNGERKLPKDCAGCHQDVHRGRLGQDCKSCHTPDGFNRPLTAAGRHQHTSFPLIGAHAMVECRECHRDVSDLGFDRTPRRCAACHADDRPLGASAVPDHTNLPTTCEQCHTPLNWGTASYSSHDRCFPISAGSNHSGFSCKSCHVGTIPQPTGTCRNATFSCVACHGCETGEHRGVRGYECKDRKCYQCHPGGSE
ncbi:MAG: hypothetical protein C4523_00990 [Myxococcales bacterium]|nr:MAG: hypothetical protein C4523_00990 [Myxococcales bacterium]